MAHTIIFELKKKNEEEEVRVNEARAQCTNDTVKCA